MPRSKKLDTDRVPYPIDEAGHAERTLSIDSLMAGENHDLLTFRKPYDMSQPVDADALRAELGPNAVIPDTDGVLYLFYFTPEIERDDPEFKPIPALIPEGHVKGIVLGMGFARSLEAAQELLYREGLLPLHDPLAGQK